MAAYYYDKGLSLYEGLQALYEKYGYRYLGDIVNYANETDRLYVKEI